MLERSGFYQQVNPETLFLSVEDATSTAIKLQSSVALHRNGNERGDLETGLERERSVTAAVADCGDIATETTTVSAASYDGISLLMIICSCSLCVL